MMIEEEQEPEALVVSKSKNYVRSQSKKETPCLSPSWDFVSFEEI